MNLQVDTPKSELTLSAGEVVQQESVGARTASTLTREAYIRAGGCPHCWPFEAPPAIAAERDPAIITESELRLLDGNR